MNKSKAKGSGFERQFAKHLKEVFDLNFERVPNSGAFIGGNNVYRSKNLSDSQQLLFEGDIIVPDELSKIKFECKFYSNFPFHKLFSSKVKQLDDWIEQAKDTDKLWFLPFKINNKGVHLVFDSKYLNLFKLPNNYMIYKEYIIILMDSFFEQNKAVLLDYCQN